MMTMMMTKMITMAMTTIMTMMRMTMTTKITAMMIPTSCLEQVSRVAAWPSSRTLPPASSVAWMLVWIFRKTFQI